MTDMRCGTFTLTEAQKEELWASAKKAQAERAARLPTEDVCIAEISACFFRLQELGWRDAIYAPIDGSPLELIEAGSTGIHTGYRDDERRFWITDSDTWPSRPILFRALTAQAPTEAT